MPTMTKARQIERDDAIARLRDLLPPGTEVRTLVRHVARSGMSRWLDVYGPDMQRITYDVGLAAGYAYSDRHDALTVGGCGMDMGFSVVYNLSRTLYPDGHACLSPDDPYARPGCPSNDHSNREHRDHHTDGGYALRQRWI